jgi:hypothetical protein
VPLSLLLLLLLSLLLLLFVQRFFAKYEFCSPYLLCCSDCEPLTMQELLAAADEDSLSRCSTLLELVCVFAKIKPCAICSR